ncbi:MAG TPA: FMN-binding protein, partial [Pseudonocardiaceae bacterium]|nr:FMN-binding protein [Pseudonocardiaceae bacterium]
AGKLSDIVVLQQTSGGRSEQIDSYALPVLKAEALAARSADIDVVSGATYTSQGYAQSLQAALDAAGR